jgi:hypothetical protein
MGGSSEHFPVDYGFPLWTVYAVWVVVLLLLYPACLGLRDSNSVGMIGG